MQHLVALIATKLQHLVSPRWQNDNAVSPMISLKIATMDQLVSLMVSYIDHLVSHRVP